MDRIQGLLFPDFAFPSSHRLLERNFLAQCEEGMVCWGYCLPGARAGCFDALSGLEMEDWLWCTSILSQGSDSSSQAGNLFLPSHGTHSDVRNLDTGFQENVGYIVLFTKALFLTVEGICHFLVIWRTRNFLNIIKSSVIYSSFLPEWMLPWSVCWQLHLSP